MVMERENSSAIRGDSIGHNRAMERIGLLSSLLKVESQDCIKLPRSGTASHRSGIKGDSARGQSGIVELVGQGPNLFYLLGQDLWEIVGGAKMSPSTNSKDLKKWKVRARSSILKTTYLGPLWRMQILGSVRLEQGTVTSLIEEKGTIKGVQYKTKTGQEL
ncbi:hypothetical protein GH714_032208 [Hevea brasiliensis]|uniref:Uncharacterized protein n=1 Tax=Hevea brasiliensis TaxID=3981 RepID=A0A6A6N7Y6_HEVBR|nr:hypothetical protein GH714_032208 [Hevea brasiliensis]